MFGGFLSKPPDPRDVAEPRSPWDHDEIPEKKQWWKRRSKLSCKFLQLGNVVYIRYNIYIYIYHIYIYIYKIFLYI